jgi:DeoR/GlpR family transcriptional regulator of sugar metabolism
MDVHERRSFIADRVTSSGEVEFAVLAETLGVSEMTIRRDIEFLESEGVLRRILGGAISLQGTSAEPSFDSRASASAREKEHIAEAVVDLLVPGETVLLDSGSTVLSVAREIRKRGLELTVVTPSALAGLELSDSPGVTVYLIGGLLRPHELSLIGPETINAIERFNCDTYVMGVAGVDAIGGISEYHYEEAHVKEAGMKVATRVIVAADQTKLGRSALVKIADLSDISILVSDAPKRNRTVAAATRLGVQVVSVQPRSQAVPESAERNPA